MALQMNETHGRSIVTAFFENEADAGQARADLLAFGFKPEDIDVAHEGMSPEAAPAAPKQNFLKSLLDIFIFMPPHERPTYEEALRRGGVAVAVKTEPQTYERAIDILDRDGAIDLDERETTWRADGWTPDEVPRAGGPGSPQQANFEARHAHDPLVNPSANGDMRERIGVGTSDMMAGMEVDPGDVTKPEAESAIGWPRRDLAHGRARVRSYVPDNDLGADKDLD